MSYDFAVWEGESPKDAGDAGEVFAKLYSRAEEMQRFVAANAREQGLVCFDPQNEELLT